MVTNVHGVSNKFSGVVLVVAPLLFGASTFFWKNGEYGTTGGTLIALSMTFWIPAFNAMFGLLNNEMPYYGIIGLLLATYGCLGGVSFGLLGFFSAAFNISHQDYIETLAKYPISTNLLLFWSGPLFPLSLLVLSINLTRKKKVDTWLGMLMALGAIAFPLSRIPRIEWIAHIADLLIAIPAITLGAKFMKTGNRRHLNNNIQNR